MSATKSLKTEIRRILYPKKTLSMVKEEAAKDFRGIEDEVIVLISEALHARLHSGDKFNIERYT